MMLRGNLLLGFIATQRFKRHLALKLICKVPALRHVRIPSKVWDTPWPTLQFSGTTSTSGVAGMPMRRVVRAALPFLAMQFVFLILVPYVPWISTVLPNTFMGPGIIAK